MVQVLFAPDMRIASGGIESAEIEADNYRQAVRELKRLYPGLTDEVFEKCSVAIDGLMITSPLLEALEPDSELVFVPRITGG